MTLPGNRKRRTMKMSVPVILADPESAFVSGERIPLIVGSSRLSLITDSPYTNGIPPCVRPAHLGMTGWPYLQGRVSRYREDSALCLTRQNKSTGCN
jgi:hypothetical protein